MPANDRPNILSVSQLNRLAREVLEDCFATVWVEGELTNFSRPASGHWYFTLKDERAQVRAAMFRGQNIRVRFKPEAGQKVMVRAKLSLYEARGDYQLIVEAMQPAGLGDLTAAFEQLKQKLATEGLFAAERKRPLPRAPRHIAVITSATGAAIRDILTVLERRSPGTRITLLPVAVQGQAAAGEIATAIARANTLVANGRQDFEVILCGRGGGSLEDLWAFNEEIVARAIAASELPVVSAVGHEVDITISDFVADARAATPSAAAELLSANRDDQLALLTQTRQRLQQAWRREQQRRRERLQHLRARLRHPGERLQQRAQQLDDLNARLLRALQLRLQRSRERLQQSQAHLQRQHPGARIELLSTQLQDYQRRLVNGVQHQQKQQRQRLQSFMALLHSVSPLATLERGYAIVRDAEGRVIRAAGQTAPGQQVNAQLAQGRLHLQVLECNED